MKQNQVQEEFVTILQGFISHQHELTNKFSQLLLRYKQQESLGIFSKISNELIQQMKMSSNQEQNQKYQLDDNVVNNKLKYKYQCEYCGKRYIHKQPMKKHFKNVHSDFRKANQLDINDVSKRKQFTSRELIKKINLDDGFQNDSQIMISSNKLSEQEIRLKLLQTLQVLDNNEIDENIINESKDDNDQLDIILLDDN